MNEPKNNSLVATIIFLCFALVAILAITLATEEPISPRTASAINAYMQTL